MRDLGWFLCLVALCGVAWLIHHESRENEKSRERHEAELRVSDRVAAAEAARLLREETEAQRAAEIERQHQRDAEARAHDEQRRVETARAEQLKQERVAAAAAQAQAARDAENERRAQEARESAAKRAAASRSSDLELARAACAAAERRVQELTTQKQTVEAELRTCRTRFDNAAEELRILDRQATAMLAAHGMSTNSAPVGPATSTANLSAEIARATAQGQTLKEEISVSNAGIAAHTVTLTGLEAELQRAVAARQKAEARLRELGAAPAPTPSAPAPAPAPSQPARVAGTAVYRLSDGRRITAVQVMKTDDSLVIKDATGAFITVKADQVVEVTPGK
jgi:hypothetical protein